MINSYPDPMDPRDPFRRIYLFTFIPDPFGNMHRRVLEPNLLRFTAARVAFRLAETPLVRRVAEGLISEFEAKV